MNEKEILKNLNQLKKVRPNKSWLTRNRDLLMAIIEADVRHDNTKAAEENRISREKAGSVSALQGAIGFFLPSNRTLILLRPAGAFLTLSIVLLTSGIFTVSAAQDTLPGDTLYNVKIVSEKVQKALTPSNQKKAELDITFAGKRLDELEQIILEPKTDQYKAEQIEIVLGDFEQSITSAQTTLTNISHTENHEEAANLAISIDERVTDYKETLEDTALAVEDELLKEIVTAAADLADETVEVSFNIIIEKHVSGDAPLSDQEIAEKIGEKLNDVNELINTVDEQIDSLISTSTDVLIEGVDSETATSTATSSETLLLAQDQKDIAEKVIEEAKELVESDDLTEAVNKINEGKHLIDAAQDRVDEFVEEAEVEEPVEEPFVPDTATSTKPLIEETAEDDSEGDIDETVAVEESPQT